MRHTATRAAATPGVRGGWHFTPQTALALLGLCGTLHAALPTPLVEFRFSEGSGGLAGNSGSLGGSAGILQPDDYPAFTNNVPSGTFAPGNNAAALDFGGIIAGQGGRSVDLTAGSGDGTLGPLNAFTVCGWANARDLTVGWGGNRIAFALAAPNGPGFDLVQLANGALRIGINQWPDGANGGGPQSSAGVLKADPQTAPANWVFFAVTYDPALEAGQLKYYFGSPSALAAPDTAHNYRGGLDNGGLIESTGFLTLGNFNDTVGARNETGPAGGSRVFRGILDEVRVYDQALDLTGVQQAQLNGALPPVPVTIVKQPAPQTVFAGQPATFSVQAGGSAPFTYQWQRNLADIPGANAASYILDPANAADNGAAFRVRISNTATPAGVWSDAAPLTVLAENGHKVFLSFSQGGTTVTNTGNLAGNGTFAVKDGYPVVAAAVPAGPFAPTSNLSCVDFGAIAAGQGGRAVDLTNRTDNTVGPLQAFTVTGWLNCRDLTEGWGGNRIVFALASPGGPGFDLVQTANGALRLGVNQWPDAGAGGPSSSEGRITADAQTSAANWVFFAVTYDGTQTAGNVTYYFGSANQAAEADLTLDYPQGEILQSGPVTLGNFSAVAAARNETGPAGGSRVFRGLMDEINVFNRLLTPVEIQAVQKAPAYLPSVIEPVAILPDEPANQTVFTGNPATFRVSASGSPPLSYQWWKRQAGADSAIPGANGSSYTVAAPTTTDSGTEYWVVVTNPASTATSRRAVLTVHAEDYHKVFLSFSEGSGTASANLGNIGGEAAFAVANELPVFSTRVPAGPFAPSGNTSSLDFGVIADGQGGRALDLTGAVTPTLGSMTGFTVTGWLNCRDLRHGWGGNRILYCQASPGVGGFDVVQEAGGILWVGVNQWPDAQPNSPARSFAALTEDSEAGEANWVFFAFSYDGTSATGNANFYFGSPTAAAVLDSTFDYDQGPITTLGKLSVGNFSTVDAGARNGTGNGGGSRVFRGLMDELNVFSRVLSLTEIQAVQKAPAGVPVQEVTLSARREGNELVVSWDSTAAFQLQYRPDVGQGAWTNEPTAPTVNGTRSNVRVPLAGAVRFYRLIKR